MSQFFFRNFENKSYIENELLYHRIKTRAHNGFILPFYRLFFQFLFRMRVSIVKLYQFACVLLSLLVLRVGCGI